MASRKTRPCSRCGKNRAEQYFTGPRGNLCNYCRRATTRRNARATLLRKNYDISLEEYDDIVAVYDGACAGCRQMRSYNLQVDHDHAVEKLLGVRASIRGGLCRRCNKLLRDCRDSAALLRSLADFLDNPPAQKVLNL